MVWNTEKSGLNIKISDLSNQLSNARSEASQVGSYKSQVASLQNGIKSLRSDLDKEQSWWNKWLQDTSSFPNSRLYKVISEGNLRNKVSEAGVYNIAFLFGHVYDEKKREGRRALREIFRRTKEFYN